MVTKLLSVYIVKKGSCECWSKYRIRVQERGRERERDKSDGANKLNTIKIFYLCT